MGRLLLPLLAALCLLGCTTSGQQAATAPPSPSAAAPAASPAITIRAPAEVILTDADVPLPLTSRRDDIGLAQAASEQENQPLALTQYRSWGWVEESTRSWGAGGARLDESLVLLTRVDGATQAFQGWAGELGQRTPCPDALALDQCAEAAGGLVARVGRYVFRLMASGVDLEKLARAQAERIRRT